MKLECIKDKLQNAVMQVERLTGKNLSLPILGSVLFEAVKGKIRLRATNLDLGIEIDVPAKVELEGRVAVSGSLLFGVLSCMGNDEKINIETINDNLSISSSKNSTLVKCLPADDFPVIPKVLEGDSLNITSQKLSLGLKSVWYAASLSDMKPEISSVHLYQEGQGLTFVATDSFRLAEKKIEIKEAGEELSLIIPYRNTVEIIRIFEGIADVVSFKYTKNQLSIVSELYGLHVTSRLAQGVFPNYRQIVPSGRATEICILKKDFLQAIKMATIFTDKFNVVSLKVVPQDKLCEINSKNGDVGESTTELEATLEGEAFSGSFNAKYLLDGFQSIKEDTIAITCNGPQKPILMRGVGDSSFTYLVMPINR